MKMLLNGKRVELAGKVFIYLAVLLCFGLSGLSARAQYTERLSQRPLIIKFYEREKNESIISIAFDDPKNGDFSWLFQRGGPTSPSLHLRNALYSYPGRNPTRPQSVTFIFLPRDNYKGVVYFFVSADDAVVHQGEVSPEQYKAKSSGGSDSYQEVPVAVPIDIFLRLAQAKKVEFKVGPKSYKNSYKLNDYGKKCLVALKDTMEETSQ